MNENEITPVDTDELKRDQAEAPKTTLPWEPASSAGLKRDEAQVSRTEVDESASVAAVPQISSELSFVCVLLPRFSDHYLVGDITDRLTVWMKEICVSYGWRLDALSIRPGYLQWIMRVPLNANPARFMRLIRQHTSENIFEEFPRFKRKNLSNEFWAPGNLVIAGNQLQALEDVNEWILQTRKQQGLV